MNFPDELWSLIFQFLDGHNLQRAGLLSKRHLRISSNRQLWNKVCLSITNHCRFELTEDDSKHYFVKYLRNIGLVRNKILIMGEDGISIINPDGSNKQTRKYSFSSFRHMQPCWSPLSDKVLYCVWTKDAVSIKVADSVNFSESKKSKVCLFDNRVVAPVYMHWNTDNIKTAVLLGTGSRLQLFLMDASNLLPKETEKKHLKLLQGQPCFLTFSPTHLEPGTMLCHIGKQLFFLDRNEKIREVIIPGYIQAIYHAPYWTPDNKFICAVTNIETAQSSLVILDVLDFQEKREHQTIYQNMEVIFSMQNPAIFKFICSPNGRYIAFLATRSYRPFGRVIHVYDIYGEKNKNRTERQHEHFVRCLFFSPDSNIILYLTDNGIIRYWNTWNLKTGEIIQYHPIDPPDEFSERNFAFFEQYHLSGTFFSPDSKNFVYTSSKQIYVQPISNTDPIPIAKGSYALWSWT